MPIDVHGAANDLRSAHLLLLANHGELTNVTASQVRDLLDVGAQSWDGFPSDGIDRSRTQACNARFLEAQVLLRRALAKLGAHDKRDLASLQLPSDFLDALGGIFDGIVLAQEMSNLAENRRLAHEVERAYEMLRRSTPAVRLHALPSMTHSPEPASHGGAFANTMGVAVGRHPQFWTGSQWFALIAAVIGVFLLLGYLIVAR